MSDPVPEPDSPRVAAAGDDNVFGWGPTAWSPLQDEPRPHRDEFVEPDPDAVFGWSPATWSIDEVHLPAEVESAGPGWAELEGAAPEAADRDLTDVAAVIWEKPTDASTEAAAEEPSDLAEETAAEERADVSAEMAAEEPADVAVEATWHRLADLAAPPVPTAQQPTAQQPTAQQPTAARTQASESEEREPHVPIPPARAASAAWALLSTPADSISKRPNVEARAAPFPTGAASATEVPPTTEASTAAPSTSATEPTAEPTAEPPAPSTSAASPAAEPTPVDVRPVDTSPTAPRPSTTYVPSGTDAAAVVQSAVTGAVAVLLVNDDPGRYAEEPEALRQALTAARRLRSDLRTFRRFVEPEWVGPLRTELAWYAGLLGGVRDVDVLAARLLQRTAARSGGGDDATVGLLDALGEWRSGTLRTLCEAMDSDRHERLVDTLTGTARALPWRSRAAEPADRALPPLLARPWRDLREAARAAAGASTDANLWTLRSRARRLREAAEACAPVLGSRVAKLATAADTLVTTTDVVHQANAMRDWLDAVADTSPELGYPAGKLWVEEGLAAEAARRAWPDNFRLVRRRWRRWRHGA